MRTTPHILLVDDDRELCSMLASYLAQDGFTCQAVHDGESALKRALSENFDALVLDVMMPGLNGFDVVRRLREKSQTPVLMLTARGDETDSIVGLEIGADDYLAKPCSPRMLAARLRAVLRRSGGVGASSGSGPHPITVEDVTLHPGTLQVTVGQMDPELTGAEFNLLRTLMEAAGHAVSKEILCEQGLGRKLTAYDRSVDIHISSLRRKLGKRGDGSGRILTMRGVGYLYALPDGV
ncbi:MAG: response regulator transcription factor [Magnetococcales bacterium]|nr:response regulator transcription factor [Magnetococcales bacterium]